MLSVLLQVKYINKLLHKNLKHFFATEMALDAILQLLKFKIFLGGGYPYHQQHIQCPS